MPLAVKNITYTYMEGTPFATTALNDVSVAIENGEFVGIIGHTGCGKSTLIQIMAGLLAPQSGQVLVNGNDIFAENYDKKLLRSTVGVVFQYPEYQLFEETVAQDVAFGPTKAGYDEQKIKQSVSWALEMVGLEEEKIAESSPFELSGGQKRKVAIAGVLATRPEILILDEPIAGLDPLGREELMGMVAGLHQSGCTVVMITHSMDDVARYATRAAVMDHGRLVMQGTPAEVFARGGEMLAMGLDVPQVCRLGALLREQGLPFDEKIYRTEDAYQALRALLTGKGAAEHAK